MKKLFFSGLTREEAEAAAKKIGWVDEKEAENRIGTGWWEEQKQKKNEPGPSEAGPSTSKPERTLATRSAEAEVIDGMIFHTVYSQNKGVKIQTKRQNFRFFENLQFLPKNVDSQNSRKSKKVHYFGDHYFWGKL